MWTHNGLRTRKVERQGIDDQGWFFVVFIRKGSVEIFDVRHGHVLLNYREPSRKPLPDLYIYQLRSSFASASAIISISWRFVGAFSCLPGFRGQCY
jgi:hypothetical protein